MTADHRLQLIVIDDSVRFALHVWRYLGKCIGIGGGSPHDPEKQISNSQLRATFWPEDLRGEPKPLVTGDGRVALWWVPGDKFLPKNFEAVRRNLPHGPEKLFLVDMRGQPGGNLGSDGERLWKRALDLVAQHFAADYDADRVMVVSSYETGMISHRGWDLRIWPKSPDTLARVEKEVPKPAERLPLSSGTLHILVTGAGFEIRNDQTGTFGLPLTGDLLVEMGPPFGDDGVLKFKEWDKKGLPCLEGCDPLEDLDAWWNQVLEKELRKKLKPLKKSTPKQRSEEKATASVHERQMREAFRRVILNYDWGQMNQSLDAADLDWCSWLTTNYTRFADRAIASVEKNREKNREKKRAKEKGREETSWQIVSTSIEALSLEREVLHGSESQGVNSRYLFKLHGDIAHLQTMAAAGYDKELFSMLSVPVDSLHQVYSAAEIFLSKALKAKKEQGRLVWHIVGHGLSDWLLLRLIERVCGHSRSENVDFIVVGLNPDEAVKRLRDSLDASFAKKIIACEATAEQYLARLRSFGGLRDPEGSSWIEKWLEELGLPDRGMPEESAGGEPGAPRDARDGVSRP